MDKIYHPQGHTEYQPTKEDDEGDWKPKDEKKRISRRTMLGGANSDMNTILDTMLAFSLKRQQYQQRIAHDDDEVQTQLRQQTLKTEEAEKQESIRKVNDWLHHGIDDLDERPAS